MTELKSEGTLQAVGRTQGNSGTGREESAPGTERPAYKARGRVRRTGVRGEPIIELLSASSGFGSLCERKWAAVKGFEREMRQDLMAFLKDHTE